MRHLFKNPNWIAPYLYPYEKLEDVPDTLFQQINEKLDAVISDTPLVTIIIAAWNEEINIIRCIATLAENISEYPFDIIVVNNNSSDKTQEALEKLHVQSLFEAKQGCGPARQTGQENAKGRFILLADADCMYPEAWIEQMTKKLLEKDVVCVYGRYSFISNEQVKRFKLALFEGMKDLVAEIRHIKHPYLNAYGLSMGYVKKYGLKVGYINHNTRGDDGRLCFDLMQYGKVKQVKSSKAVIWTFQRTLERDGGFFQMLGKRFYKEIARFGSYFQKRAPHDTHTSKNWGE